MSRGRINNWEKKNVDFKQSYCTLSRTWNLLTGRSAYVTNIKQGTNSIVEIFYIWIENTERNLSLKKVFQFIWVFYKFLLTCINEHSSQLLFFVQVNTNCVVFKYLHSWFVSFIWYYLCVHVQLPASFDGHLLEKPTLLWQAPKLSSIKFP